ncbi:MAG: spore maturation protein [Gammaproteobacteria bacterium]|nr:spore maturation protein [Gammaproteobacteria bacterium]MDH5735619.1 spore maturation protein [Gammaproteobacteria bacterium]
MHHYTALIIPLLILFIVSHGLYKKLAVYEEFVDGAKEGFTTAVRIIPYLVAILFAIAMFRASGAMESLINLIEPVFVFFGIPPETLPMAIIRPMTGSGSVAVLADLIETHGDDSLIVKIAATMFGSTETTFYVLAVYFGSINIKKTGYALQAGLIADLVGFIAAVSVCYWYFS